MADTGDQLLREVEEDLQREQWLRLWNTYGRYAVTAIVLVIVIVAGYMGYQEYRQSQLAADGHSFWVAERNMTLGETDQAVAIFRSLVEDGAEGYPYLAGLRAAEALAASGDRDGALALYDQLSNEQGLEQRYRQLAALYGVMLLVDEGDPVDVENRIEPLLQGDWRHSAMEMQGLLQLRTGDRVAAAETFTALIADPNTPTTLRNRAAELLSIAGGGS